MTAALAVLKATQGPLDIFLAPSEVKKLTTVHNF